ncbi:MAG: hypothetical protein K6E39_02515 [Lachnospiraceae bacterium]|nr:hypothetical protein [Lachnospiraceae bacterium]
MIFENEMDIINAFLDANTYDEKYNIIRLNPDLMTDKVIDTLAAAMDTIISDGPIDRRYEDLKGIILTNRKFEVIR